MKCAEVTLQLEALFDGALDRATKEAIELHLSGCPECRAANERLHELNGLLQKPPVVAPSPALDARVMNSFDDHWAAIQARLPVKTPWWKRRITLPAPAFALSIILPLILASLGTWYGAGRIFTPQRGIGTTVAPSPNGTAGPAEPGMEPNLSRFDHGERAVIYKVRRAGAGNPGNLER